MSLEYGRRKLLKRTELVPNVCSNAWEHDYFGQSRDLEKSTFLEYWQGMEEGVLKSMASHRWRRAYTGYSWSSMPEEWQLDAEMDSEDDMDVRLQERQQRPRAVPKYDQTHTDEK